MRDYPEHQKLKQVQVAVNNLVEFMKWMESLGLYFPSSKLQLAFRFYGIDIDKYYEEKSLMLGLDPYLVRKQSGEVKAFSREDEEYLDEGTCKSTG